jgi:hypothetical protein
MDCMVSFSKGYVQDSPKTSCGKYTTPFRKKCIRSSHIWPPCSLLTLFSAHPVLCPRNRVTVRWKRSKKRCVHFDPTFIFITLAHDSYFLFPPPSDRQFSLSDRQTNGSSPMSTSCWPNFLEMHPLLSKHVFICLFS